MTPREQLERAIGLAHAQRPDLLKCIECGCDIVVAEYRAALGAWIPVSCHFAVYPDACPALRGGVATFRAHEDLWAALEPHLFVAHYGEVADVGLADDELAALL